MARRLAGEITPAEQIELEQLVQSSPDIHFPLQTLTDLWKEQTYKLPHSDPETEEAYLNHIERLKTTIPGREKNGRKNLLPYMVILISILVLIFFGMPKKTIQPTLPPISEISTKSGSKTKLVLPDGSRVWLNAKTKLTYDERFGKELREVKLTGEAFFEVVRDSLKPFLIHTNNMDLKVLGTSFNVKSYPGEHTSEASLISGSLEISLTARNKQKIILRPSEKLVISNDSVQTSHKTISGKTIDQSIISIKNLTHFEEVDSIIIETSWVKNQLVFQDESFKDIALKMEKWYGVVINFQQAELEQLRFTGIFEKETIEQALYALSISEPFKCNVSPNGITISSIRKNSTR
jgi:ferric-dicitrate binding protein FerR (iron transport regulator)